ncbi:MAG: histidine ABC transporter permease HisM [Candidimonas sp.]|nr:MAG: histidine ABC transporter permease HisM [Candidimonas sp.]TAM22669.1 MAG: histidine ABC transporter permease HisM [Candidimonas sp.]TAM74458.1 MAG: histidine ABC transporter permease HisM [Candidimonas sp.]
MIDIFRQYWPQYVGLEGGDFSGTAMTLWILVLTWVISFAASIPLAILRVSSNKYLSRPVQLYTFLITGTPLYVQLLIVYTGFFGLDFVRHTPTLSEFFRSGFNCVILAFSVNCCAYITEVLAGSIRSLPSGEIEAARAFGFSRVRTYTKIILPSAIKRALPYYSNEVILVLHSTSIAFTATVPELLKVARDVNSATFASFSAFGIAAVFYAAVALVLVATFRMLEKRCLVFLKPLPTH